MAHAAHLPLCAVVVVCRYVCSVCVCKLSQLSYPTVLINSAVVYRSLGDRESMLLCALCCYSYSPSEECEKASI